MDTKFCSCPEETCPHHPINHNKGCTPCILKNLKKGEIPNCFYLKEVDTVEGMEDYSKENYARIVLENEKHLNKEK